MRIFVNALASSAGGGITYLRNVVPHLAEQNVEAVILALPEVRDSLPSLPNISFQELKGAQGTCFRFWQEQSAVPEMVRRSGARVLLSTGNIAARRSPVPQILLSRNSLYTSGDFRRDLWGRGEYGLWLDTCLKGFLARRSVSWATCTVAPSRSFADELQRWTGKPVTVICHGFDHEAFFAAPAPLPSELEQKLQPAGGEVRLLLVSHYNYFRNFETVFRALSILKQGLAPRRVRLFLTCKLGANQNPGSYRTEGAAALVKQLGIEDEVVQLGTVPYSLLHYVYKACQLYVTASYAETFSHPLVEAMACGLPVVASDLPVHREICQEAGVYFERFSPGGICERVMQVVESHALRDRLSRAGVERSRDFSWSRHAQEILRLANKLTESGMKRT